MAEHSLKICTVYFEGMYSPDYIGKLYDSLKKHTTRDFEFICLSDNDTVKADKIIPLKMGPIQRHWHKLRFMDPKLSGGDEIIIMDIDQIILQNIDEMINYPVGNNEIVTYDRWWKSKYYKEKGYNPVSINGGWYKFKGDSLKCIYDDFMKDPEERQLRYYNNGTIHTKYYGEQNYVEDSCIENNIKIITMPGEWTGKLNPDQAYNIKNNVKYCQQFGEDYMYLGGKLNPKIKIIHYSGVDVKYEDIKRLL